MSTVLALRNPEAVNGELNRKHKKSKEKPNRKLRGSLQEKLVCRKSVSPLCLLAFRSLEAPEFSGLSGRGEAAARAKRDDATCRLSHQGACFPG